jgi:hypothetical protein
VHPCALLLVPSLPRSAADRQRRDGSACNPEIHATKATNAPNLLEAQSNTDNKSKKDPKQSEEREDRSLHKKQCAPIVLAVLVGSEQQPVEGSAEERK